MNSIIKNSFQRITLVCTLSLGFLASYSPSLQSQTSESPLKQLQTSGSPSDRDALIRKPLRAETDDRHETIGKSKSSGETTLVPFMPPPLPDTAKDGSTGKSKSSGETTIMPFVPPPLPDTAKDGPTGRIQGGGTRGPCQKYKDLTALVPVTEGFVWGLTSAERPTFWFFVPEPLTTELPTEFVLQDGADNYVYKTSWKMPKMQSGVVSISVPSTAKPLDIGKGYRWTFSIACDPARPSASVFVQGSLQRMGLDPVLERQLEAATLRERVDLYAANGIWYDALTNLIQLRQTNPEDASLVRDWKSFLQSVGLEAIAQQPIVQCCTPEK